MQIVAISVRIGNQITVEQTNGVVRTGEGYVATVARSEQAVFRLTGVDANSCDVITSVRSLSPPNVSSPTVTEWTVSGTEFVSPAFGYGAHFRIEVQNSAGASSTPLGGGHFWVVEEGGGGG